MFSCWACLCLSSSQVRPGASPDCRLACAGGTLNPIGISLQTGKQVIKHSKLETGSTLQEFQYCVNGPRDMRVFVTALWTLTGLYERSLQRILVGQEIPADKASCNRERWEEADWPQWLTKLTAMIAHVALFDIIFHALNFWGGATPAFALGVWGGTAASHMASRGMPNSPKT